MAVRKKKMWKPAFGSRESELGDIVPVSVPDIKSFMRDCFENLIRGNALSFLGYPLKYQEQCNHSVVFACHLNFKKLEAKFEAQWRYQCLL